MLRVGSEDLPLTSLAFAADSPPISAKREHFSVQLLINCSNISICGLRLLYNAGTMSTRPPSPIPIKYEFEGSLRRSVIDDPPELRNVRAKLALSFPHHAHAFHNMSRTLKLVYTDDEGDVITICTNDELAAAYRQAQKAGRVLRFSVPAFKESEAPSTKRSKYVPGQAGWNENGEWMPRTRVHWGVQCDKCGQLPIVGTRFHKRGEDYDLCEKEYLKLPDAEKQLFQRYDSHHRVLDFLKPCLDATSRPEPNLDQHAGQAGVVMHWRVFCDKSGQCPIVGPRFHKRGVDYDLCEAEFRKLPRDQQKLFDRYDSQVRLKDW